jgi:hypothetical protein
VIQAVGWLGSHAGGEDVVLASAGFGNLVPAQCACRVVIGQNFQSLDFHRRQAEVYAFYAAPNTRVALRALSQIVRREGVSLVVFSPLESGVGRMVVHAIPGFSRRYDLHGVTIFQRLATPNRPRMAAHR